MKQNPTEKLIRQRMTPGILSDTGFLGDDPRPLADIIAQDLDELTAANLSLDDLASFLENLLAIAEANLENPVELYNGQITISLMEGMGHIPCPFGCGDRARKGILTIKTPDQTFQLPPLTIHLIRQHGFFQGKHSPFRLEPADAITLYKTSQGDRL